MIERRPLYVCLKPPSSVAERIWHLEQTARNRAAELLHITAMPLFDCASRGRPQVSVDVLKEVLASVRVRPFELWFDRVYGRGQGIELRSTRRLIEAKSFRQTLTDVLIDRFSLPLMRPGKLRPHLTINYRRGIPPCDIPILPVHWMAEEFLLVESVHGETRHVELGRWPLA